MSFKFSLFSYSFVHFPNLGCCVFAGLHASMEDHFCSLPNFNMEIKQQLEELEKECSIA
jgi:hypothetical protein